MTHYRTILDNRTLSQVRALIRVFNDGKVPGFAPPVYYFCTDQ